MIECINITFPTEWLPQLREICMIADRAGYAEGAGISDLREVAWAIFNALEPSKLEGMAVILTCDTPKEGQ